MAATKPWHQRQEMIDDLAILFDRLWSIQKQRSAFRGQAVSTWRLQTKLDRACGYEFGFAQHGPRELSRERGEIDAFRRKAWRFLDERERAFLGMTPADLVREDPLDRKLNWETPEIWSALQIARHYGVPTRLLDWTDDARVAAYFACINDADQDGAIWWFDQVEFERIVHQSWGSWLVPKRVDGTDERALEKRAFDGHATRWLSKIHQLFPFERMHLQKGFFTACGTLGVLHDELFDELNAGGHIACGRILIPKRLKRQVLDFLERLSIHAKRIDYPGADLCVSKSPCAIRASYSGLMRPCVASLGSVRFLR